MTMMIMAMIKTPSSPLCSFLYALSSLLRPHKGIFTAHKGTPPCHSVPLRILIWGPDSRGNRWWNIPVPTLTLWLLISFFPVHYWLVVTFKTKQPYDFWYWVMVMFKVKTHWKQNDKGHSSLAWLSSQLGKMTSQEREEGSKLNI